MTKILDSIKPSSEVEATSFIKALLAGESGSGKTSAALTCPGKKLLIDADHRAGEINSPEIYIKQFSYDKKRPGKSWETLIDLNNELWEQVEKNELKYEVVIIDGLTSLCDFGMKWSLNLKDGKGKKMTTSPGGGPAMNHYGPQMHQLMNFIRSIIPLPCHVIFTCHLDMYQDEMTKKLHYYPKVYGKIRSEIPTLFNETYESYRKKVDGEIKFFWDTTGDADRLDFLKSSFNKPLGKLWKGPFEVDLEETPCGFAKILNLVGKGKEGK